MGIVQSAMKRSGFPFEFAEGEAAFYGPKVDFQIKSVVGREESASTNQLDFIAAKRFNLTYKDKDGKDIQVEKSPLELIKKFVESFPKLVEFAEVSGDKKDILTFKADGEGEVTYKGERFKVDDLELASKARKYSEEHNVPFSEAVVEVSRV